MTDLLLQIGLSNLLVSLVLAIAAWCVHRTSSRPALAHLLWVLVLVKLVTPPMFTLPVVPVPDSGRSADVPALETFAADLPVELVHSVAAAEVLPYNEPIGSAWSRTDVLIGMWLLGSACILAWSLVRVYRFNRVLHMGASSAPHHVQRCAHELAQRFGLRTTPIIETTSARVSPMVWWIGGRVRIVLPIELVEDMNDEQMRWVLAHELAHVRRHDHVVRWLEWLACVGFWWNPISWVARRYLRINEEICCDALVLSTFQNTHRRYAQALMAVVEFLSSPALRPPAVASEINSGGCLERRFRMIVSRNTMRKTPRWLNAGVLVAAVGILPVGIAYGQQVDAVQARLHEAVKNGEISKDQAHVMMGALKAYLADESQPEFVANSTMPEDKAKGGVYIEYINGAKTDKVRESAKARAIYEERLAVVEHQQRALETARKQIEAKAKQDKGAYAKALADLQAAKEALAEHEHHLAAEKYNIAWRNAQGDTTQPEIARDLYEKLITETRAAELARENVKAETDIEKLHSHLKHLYQQHNDLAGEHVEQLHEHLQELHEQYNTLRHHDGDVEKLHKHLSELHAREDTLRAEEELANLHAHLRELKEANKPMDESMLRDLAEVKQRIAEHNVKIDESRHHINQLRDRELELFAERNAKAQQKKIDETKKAEELLRKLIEMDAVSSEKDKETLRRVLESLRRERVSSNDVVLPSLVLQYVSPQAETKSAPEDWELQIERKLQSQHEQPKGR
ncbi:MAG: M48 family metalloprotease [Phycisphaeraceae bacterium]|nr:M48 family metalloprotease [Phycisphaerales bacterium]MCB9860012.1 M48 family metalloprotease [Phycisphaeraceae bacterium]